jgi:hypothetical protein
LDTTNTELLSSKRNSVSQSATYPRNPKIGRITDQNRQPDVGADEDTPLFSAQQCSAAIADANIDKSSLHSCILTMAIASSN